jgi:hypothetical protein
MGLRGFSATNAGCVHELRYLTGHMPFDRCVLIVDGTTDERFLDHTLNDAWNELGPGSPNHGRSRGQTAVQRFTSGGASLSWLVRRLCDARAG